MALAGRNSMQIACHQEQSEADAEEVGINAIEQIERRQHPEHATGHEQRAAAPLHAAAQRDQRSGLCQRAARHHQRHRLGRRQHV
jgi:hypothetical protein